MSKTNLELYSTSLILKTHSFDNYLILQIKQLSEQLNVVFEIVSISDFNHNTMVDKCDLSPINQINVKQLEKQWALFKYLVLEHDASKYFALRQLLKNKTDDITKHFYELIEGALKVPPTIGSVNNALSHVWGYFKNIASTEEKARVTVLIADVQNNIEKTYILKRYFFELALKYNQRYLLASYYLYCNYNY